MATLNYFTTITSTYKAEDYALRFQFRKISDLMEMKIKDLGL